MRRPQNLLAVVKRGHVERRAPGVMLGERNVLRRMPVLRHDNMRKIAGKPIDHGHDFIAMSHGQRASRHEIVLYIDHE
jgi:hypothetical protein